MGRHSSYYCSECDREYDDPRQGGDKPRCPVDGSELFVLPEGLTPGAVVDGRYTVVKPLGRGGMGVVFAAEHQATGQKVAIKLINAVGDDDVAVRRFFREAKASSRVVHPSVVEVYDFGQSTDGRPYMVMEILDGVPLDQLLSTEGALHPKRAANIAAQVADALVASHELGILHRDLKPSNIMLRRQDDVERVKVLDFGLARAVEDDTGELGTITATGMLVGTPQYMSPEQFRCETLGPPTDFYSLGVIFYEMLTGRFPFSGDDVFELMQGHVMEEPVAPTAVAPEQGIPQAVEAICLRLLAKEEDRRAVDAQTLAEELRGLAGDDSFLINLDTEKQMAPDSLELKQPALKAPTVDPRSLASGQLERFRPGLIGREQTRSFLRRILERSLDSSKPSVVILEGPGGMGKSTLLEWYETRALRLGCRVVRGVHSEGHLGAQGALKEALEKLLGVVGQPWETVEKSLEEVLEVGDESLGAGRRERLRRFLRPEVVRSGEYTEHGGDDLEILYEVILDLLQRATADSPTMVVFDDLREEHPFDDLLLDRLATRLSESEQPLVIAMAVRTEDSKDPEQDETSDESMVSSLALRLREQFYRVELGPLDDDEVATMIRRAMPGITEEATGRVAELSGGNPLFTLQLLRDMVEQGSLQHDSGEWELVGDPTLPEDLRAVIDARLDRLEERHDEQRLLIRAALVGQRVPLDLLETVLELEESYDLLDEIDEVLDRLVDDGWLRDAESWDEEAVVFAHGFVHEALRDRFGSEEAAGELHRHVAEALEEYYADELEPVALRIAEHFLAGSEEHRAAPYLVEAARAAEARYAMGDAVQIWRRARGCLERAEVDGEIGGRVGRGLVRTLIYVGEYEEADQVLDELGDAAKEMELRGDLADVRAQFDEALRFYDDAIDRVSSDEDSEWAARLHLKFGYVCRKRGEYERANEAIQAGLSLTVESKSLRLEADGLTNLAMSVQLAGDLDRSLDCLQRAEEAWRAVGDDVELGRCLYTKGALYWRMSEFPEALVAFGEAIPLLERAGHRRGLGHCLRMAGAVAEKLDRLDEALAYCRRAHRAFSYIDDPRGLQRVALCFADVHSARGEYEKAINWAMCALEKAVSSGEAASHFSSLITLGDVHAESGDGESAIEYFEQALAMEEIEKRKYAKAYIHERLGQVLLEGGDEKKGRMHLREAVALYEEIGNIRAATATKEKLDGG